MDVAMSDDLRIHLPLPDGEWCGVCAAFYKYAFVQMLAARIKELESDGKPGMAILTLSSLPKGDAAKLPPLHEPVASGVSHMAPMLGTTGLCWSHLPAIGGQASPLVLGNGGLPPGLIRGSG